MRAELTLGAEEELHLIDLETKQLAAHAPQVLARLPKDNFSAELQRTTVETNTPVVDSLDGLREQLITLRKAVIDAAAPDGIGIAAVGTAPRSEHKDFELTSTGRYGRMQEQYRMLVDEQLICGTQIHVGVSDRELAVQIAQRIARDLPVLLSASASSPYWNGQDTGYASIRTIIWQRWPSAGATGPLASAAEYDRLLDDLIATGVIADSKMAYFDVRPSSHAPTLELRVCDAMPIVDDAVLVAGLFRGLVRSAELDIEAGRPFRSTPPPIQRAATWQAARGGLAGSLLDHTEHPRPVPAAEALRSMIARLQPALELLGDLEQVRELAEALIARGNSADRQRAVFAEHGTLDAVVDAVVAETHGPASGPILPVPSLRTYRVRAGDEAVATGGRPRTAYQPILEHFRGLGPERLGELHAARDATVLDAGISFRLDGEDRPFPVDLVPRVLQAHEWSELAAGLEQRARALECFLQDVYGEGRAVRDGVVRRPAGTAGWREEATRLPRGVVRGPVMGFDLVRNEFGGWRVLEDNLRNPSGMAYAMGIRSLLDEVLPDLPRPTGLLDPSDTLDALRRTLAAGARRTDGREPVLALLSSGADSSAWFEHRRLAEGAGLLLLELADLEVDGGRVLASGTQVDVLYLRLDDELAELGVGDRPLGREIVEVAASGGVFLANAPGNGIADDKALYCAVPELIGYYLDERPLLESVPTYRPEDEAERRIVLERVGELVTKPVDGYGGRGVMIGPSAPAARVAERRAAIAAEPEGWVAQEVVRLSSLPSFSGTELQPRHVDLRAFVFVTGTGAADVRLAPLALTRVAAEGSMIVNSSRGGGAKDTWIVRA
ncbi:carboxylate--amine ligase/circularly permuted type 2 ATP-grasp protein [Rathayibacter caricis]|uniref:carboxylate--amine ligase/circularly permuted type 2 ATP-grasp protein n=1 Tax=Rathayibacter caricis TaxID=110936 RepID=UPI001FB3FE90|nr:carboxylate--amine ligase/circularly permuted type 2 ATP-grasp protein [Rathayibacter caricis]MCJ1695643.1 carboxylate--amine ligase/circularly permuted type 2 ATP-grasp protein [Rathayibacter caricis]